MRPLQSLGSGQKSSWSRDSSGSPLSHIEEDHVYRCPLHSWDVLCLKGTTSVKMLFYLQWFFVSFSVFQTNTRLQTRHQQPWPLAWAVTSQSWTGFCWNLMQCNRALLPSPLQVEAKKTSSYLSNLCRLVSLFKSLLIKYHFEEYLSFEIPLEEMVRTVTNRKKLFILWEIFLTAEPYACCVSNLV